jgi:hypothetical protein
MLVESKHPKLEECIASALGGMVRELRFVDLSHYIGYAQMEKFNCIKDVVISAAEFYFQPGFVRFEDITQTSANWGEAAFVSLQISFDCIAARNFVNIVLHDTHAEIILAYTDRNPLYDDPEQIEAICCREFDLNLLRKPIMHQHTGQLQCSNRL